MNAVRSAGTRTREMSNQVLIGLIACRCAPVPPSSFPMLFLSPPDLQVVSVQYSVWFRARFPQPLQTSYGTRVDIETGNVLPACRSSTSRSATRPILGSSARAASFVAL